MYFLTQQKTIQQVLLEDRIIFLDDEVTDALSTSIVQQLLYLESKDATKDIYLYINSPGGSVTAGLSIIDTMNYIRPDIITVCMGRCASMGATILSFGTVGKRCILPNAEVMIHQASGGGQGKNADIQVIAKHMDRTNRRLFRMLATNCNKPLEKIINDCTADRYMTAEEALKYGIVDKIITRKAV